MTKNRNFYNYFINKKWIFLSLTSLAADTIASREAWLTPMAASKCWFISNSSRPLLYDSTILLDCNKSTQLFTIWPMESKTASTTRVWRSRLRLTFSTNVDVERSTWVSTTKTRGAFDTVMLSNWLSCHKIAPPYVTTVLSIPDGRPWKNRSHVLEIFVVIRF